VGFIIAEGHGEPGLAQRRVGADGAFELDQVIGAGDALELAVRFLQAAGE
jgi:hypothetical protein